jgi:hypothetical protein
VKRLVLAYEREACVPVPESVMPDELNVVTLNPLVETHRHGMTSPVPFGIGSAERLNASAESRTASCPGVVPPSGTERTTRLVPEAGVVGVADGTIAKVE